MPDLQLRYCLFKDILWNIKKIYMSILFTLLFGYLCVTDHSDLLERDPGAAPWCCGDLHWAKWPTHQRAIPETAVQNGLSILSVDSDIIYYINDITLIWRLSILFQQYPDYYAIIKEPIDLKIIAQRIQVWFISLMMSGVLKFSQILLMS